MAEDTGIEWYLTAYSLRETRLQRADLFPEEVWMERSWLSRIKAYRQVTEFLYHNVWHVSGISVLPVFTSWLTYQVVRNNVHDASKR